MRDATFIGRSFDHWFGVDEVMKSNGIKTAGQLKDALRKPKPDPMVGRVFVVDSRNTDRVLGSVPRPRGNSPRLDGGDCYNMATMSRISMGAMPYDPCEDMLSVSHVRFGFRCVNWTVMLTTDASLDLLVRIDGFQLPGESEEQAHVRNMYAR